MPESDGGDRLIVGRHFVLEVREDGIIRLGERARPAQREAMEHDLAVAIHVLTRLTRVVERMVVEPGWPRDDDDRLAVRGLLTDLRHKLAAV